MELNLVVMGTAVRSVAIIPLFKNLATMCITLLTPACVYVELLLELQVLPHWISDAFLESFGDDPLICTLNVFYSS